MRVALRPAADRCAPMPRLISSQSNSLLRSSPPRHVRRAAPVPLRSAGARPRRPLLPVDSRLVSPSRTKRGRAGARARPPPARPQAIASSVTLQNVSVIEGLKNTSIPATQRPSSAPLQVPAKRAWGRSPRTIRAGPSPSPAPCAARRGWSLSMVAANSAGLFHYTRPRKRSPLLSAMPMPRRSARSRTPNEKSSVSTPRDQMPMSRCIAGGANIDHPVRGRDQRIAPAVRAAQPGPTTGSMKPSR